VVTQDGPKRRQWAAPTRSGAAFPTARKPVEPGVRSPRGSL